MRAFSAKTALALAGAAAVVLFSPGAGAQDTEGELRPHTMKPVDRALELSIGTGYAEGFGNVGANARSLQDLSAAGGAVQMAIGYRVIPHLTLGVYGSGAAFAHGGTVDRNTNLQSWTAGIDAGWHFLPSSVTDPVVSLGTGWRAYGITTTSGDTWQHGLEMARLQVALDYRLTPQIAISPVVGADLSMFLTQWAPGDAGYQPMASPNVNTFVFAGVLGRFDLPTGEPERVAEIVHPEVKVGVYLEPAPQPAAPPEGLTELQAEPAGGGVKIANDILVACNIPDADAYFAFDAPWLEKQDIPGLDRLAACFGPGGALEGRTMTLIGRADPRGAVDYNYRLGQHRADTVRSYLLGHGIDAAKIQTSSRGAADAVGKDETGWAFDRRVDVMLGD